MYLGRTRMRVSTELLLLGLFAAFAAWVSRAPAEPEARAEYFCAPVVAASLMADHVESALSDTGQVVPPAHAWHVDPQRDCPRVLLRLTAGPGA